MKAWEQLEEIRKKKGISKTRLAELVNVGSQSMIHYLNGKRELKAELYLEICKALNWNPFTERDWSDSVSGTDITTEQHLALLEKHVEVLEENTRLLQEVRNLEDRVRKLSKK